MSETGMSGWDAPLLAHNIEDETICRRSVHRRKEGMLLRLVQSRP